MLVVDPVYQQHLDDLRAYAAAVLAAEQGDGVRPWFIPTGFTGDLLDILELHTPGFRREALNTAYAQALQDPDKPGKTAEGMALKTQIDELASAERAWRFRHASVPRQLAHAAARQYGLANGPLYATIRNAVSNLLRASSPRVPAS